MNSDNSLLSTMIGIVLLALFVLISFFQVASWYGWAPWSDAFDAHPKLLGSVVVVGGVLSLVIILFSLALDVARFRATGDKWAIFRPVAYGILALIILAPLILNTTVS